MKFKHEMYLLQRLFIILMLPCLLAFGSPATVTQAASQNPSHEDMGFSHVLLISVDGLHAQDLANYVKSNPNSTLAALSNRGVTYNNAATTTPSDSFPGLLALVTGGTPKTTGVYYDDSYDRNLLPPGSSNTPGTEVVYDESIDFNPTLLNGGGGIDPKNLPRDPVTKQPVYPHSFLRVNTIFEVIKAAGMLTAWSDKHLAYDLVNGPSGAGVDDLFTPEIGATITNSLTDTENYDDIKVAAILNEIDGMDHTGTTHLGVPAIFGMNFQEVSVGQKLPGNGYLNAQGAFSAGLLGALNHTDQSLGKMVTELKKQHLYDSTLIIITAKHGQSPIDPTKLQFVNKSAFGINSSLIAQITTDDVALIWLTDSSQTAAVVATINANKVAAHVQSVTYFGSPNWLFDDPTKDSRTPDILVQPIPGTIYTHPGSKIAEHGGGSMDDTHVALLLSYAGAEKNHVNSHVSTTQVAPTILKALGLNPWSLQAVQAEKTKLLPGFFNSHE